MKATPQQEAAYEAIANVNSGNVVIEAVPGSGKTTTLIGGLQRLGYCSVAFCAFSKPISVEITNKVDAIRESLKANVQVGTVHSFGSSALRRVYPRTKVPKEKTKIDQMMEVVVHGRTNEVGVPLELRNFVRKAYQFSRQWGVGIVENFRFNSVETWYALIDHFDLEETLIPGENIPENLDELIKQSVQWTVYCLKLGIKLADKMIDFEDMIWLPIFLNIKMPQFDVILVDECQDINITKRILIKKMMRVGL